MTAVQRAGRAEELLRAREDRLGLAHAAEPELTLGELALLRPDELDASRP